MSPRPRAASIVDTVAGPIVAVSVSAAAMWAPGMRKLLLDPRRGVVSPEMHEVLAAFEAAGQLCEDSSQPTSGHSQTLPDSAIDTIPGGPHTALMTYGQAAKVLGYSTRTIARRVEAGQLEQHGRRVTAASVRALGSRRP